MVIITEEIDLPTAQPKSFQLPLVSPSNNDFPIPQSTNKAPRSPISLRLRRVTPDRFQRGGGSVSISPRAKSPGGGGIERIQKLQDEFYDGPQEEDELDDGELPSLSRTSSNPRSGGRVSRSPRPAVIGYWSQDDDDDGAAAAPNNDADDIAASISAKNMSNNALANSARKRMASSSSAVGVSDTTSPMDEREFERVKVAGFWSQLDEVSDGGSMEDEENTRNSRLPAIHYEEQEPDDERDWRRGQSPEVGGGTNTRVRPIGRLQQRSVGGDTDEDETWKEEETNGTHTYPDSTKTKNHRSNNWNLIEKAACFANERERNHPDYATVDNHSDGSHQSLDRFYQTSTSHTAGATYDTRTKESGTYNQTTAMKEEEENEDDEGMFHCLTDALGTICGYSTYVGDTGVEVAPSDEEKKARALAIMEGQRAEEGYTDDEESKFSKNLHGMGSYDSEFEQEEEEEVAMSESEDAAAIELEYLSRDDKEEAEDQMSTRDNMASNTVVAGVAAIGAGALVAATVTSKSPEEEMAPAEVPMSPVSEAKKKRLTVKAVKNLLGLRKKKEVVNEETPNLAAVMSRSAKGASESEPAPSSSGAAVAVGASALGAAAVGAAVMSNKNDAGNDMPEMEDVDDDSIFTDDEDEPQDTTHEESTLGGLNSYNNQDEPKNTSYKNRSIFDEEELESQAAGWDSNRKNSYLRDLAQRAKQEYHQKKSLDHSDPDLTAGVTASMGVSALGAAAVGGAVLMNRDYDEEEDSKAEQYEDAASANESTAESKGSYNVDYNSFNPLEKRKFLRLLNSGMAPQEATRIIVDEREENIPVLQEADDGDEEEEEDSDYESEEDDADKSAYSHDPPGSVLEGGSGESAEPSVREVEETQDISRSEKATAGGTSRDAAMVVAGTTAAAAVAVPAIVRAKSKKSPGQHGDDGDEEQQQEEVYQRGADGLVSVGDKYYDSFQASYEQEDVDNTLLLDRENGKKSKKISKKPSVSGFAKVTSRRSIVSPRSNSSKFTSVNEGSIAQQHFSRPNSTNSANIQADEPVDGAISPRSEASASKAPKKFNFNIHRGSKWAKVGSNLDSDVAAAPTVEEDQKEFYSPRFAPAQIEDTRSPMSIPDDETPGSRYTYGQSASSATSANRSRAVEPSTEASHVALPSLLPTDARGRNVVTPTNEMEENETEENCVFSPAETASRANSLFMSPDTLSPTSPQDFGSITETPRSEQDQQASRGIHNSSRFQPVYSPADAQFTTNSSASQNNSIPLVPDSPSENFSPNERDGNSITNYSLAEQSFVTLGTTWTVASKSSRRRHRGAAGKRLMEAKEAESHAGPKAKGWMGSIQDVAVKCDQVWDPERGWQDYTEPERVSHFGETKPIGSLHLSEKIAHRKQKPAIESRAIAQGERGNESVDFPHEWASERKNMIDLVQPQVLATVENSERGDIDTDRSALASDVSTVNTSADSTSLLHKEHAVVRRTKPKQKASADTRKTSAVDSQVRSVGWKESMEVATAEISDENRQWNYEEGWVENKDFADDVSELTKVTSERTPGSQMQASPVEVISPISPTHFLPSVAEGIAESESQAEEEALAEDRAIQELTKNDDDRMHKDNGANSPDNEYESEEEEFDVDQMMLQDNPVGDSDKENDLSNVGSDDDDSEDLSPKLATEEFPLVVSNNARSLNHDKPPLPKRSLNQWLERSLKDNAHKSPDVESENAVNSRETNGDSLDDIQVDEGTTREINVVRGK